MMEKQLIKMLKNQKKDPHLAEYKPQWVRVWIPEDNLVQFSVAYSIVH